MNLVSNILALYFATLNSKKLAGKDFQEKSRKTKKIYQDTLISKSEF